MLLRNQALALRTPDWWMSDGVPADFVARETGEPPFRNREPNVGGQTYSDSKLVNTLSELT
jgi:hypothetical protein